MQSQSLPIVHPVSRTLVRRWTDALEAGLRHVAAWWRRRRQQREDDSALQTLAHLDPRTLKDIGMPDEARSRVAALREARSERLAAELAR
jgi:hypothetical protein